MSTNGYIFSNPGASIVSNATGDFYFEFSFTTLETGEASSFADSVAITGLRFAEYDRAETDSDTGQAFGTYSYNINWSISSDGVTYSPIGDTTVSITDGQTWSRVTVPTDYSLEMAQTYTVRLALSPAAGDDYIYFDDIGMVLTYTDTSTAPIDVHTGAVNFWDTTTLSTSGYNFSQPSVNILSNATEDHYFEFPFVTSASGEANSFADAVAITGLRFGEYDRAETDSDTGQAFGSYSYDINWSVSSDGVTYSPVAQTTVSIVDGQSYTRVTVPVEYALEMGQSYTMRLELTPAAGDDHIYFDDIGIILTYRDTDVNATTDEFTIDTNTVIKSDINPGFGSGVLAWLKYAPKNNIEPGIQRLGLGSLRFPAGHPADYYLWHDIDAGDPLDGLQDKMATASTWIVGNQAKWGYAVNPDATLSDNAMDFDEYMALCTRLDVAPLVVVNAMSHKFTNGPTQEKLVATAAAWVQYANDKGYEVAYWQIGNEIDHNSATISLAEYVEIYHQIASAMKAVDPTVQVGPGILDQIGYYRAVCRENIDNVDFLTVHNYLHTAGLSTYEDWRDRRETLLLSAANAITVSGEYGDLPVLVTETNSRGTLADLQGRDVNDYLKTMVWFDLLMEQVVSAPIEYSYFWSISDLWTGEADPPRGVTYTLLDENYNLTMRGQVTRLINEHILENAVDVSYGNANLRAYAFTGSTSSDVHFMVINKSMDTQSVTINCNAFTTSSTGAVTQFTAESTHSLENDIAEFTETSETGVFSMDLPPISITAIKFTNGVVEQSAVNLSSLPELSFDNGRTDLKLTNHPMKPYRLQRSTDLINWTDVVRGSEVIESFNNEDLSEIGLQISEELDEADRAFYRAVQD